MHNMTKISKVEFWSQYSHSHVSTERGNMSAKPNSKLPGPYQFGMEMACELTAVIQLELDEATKNPKKIFPPHFHAVSDLEKFKLCKGIFMTNVLCAASSWCDRIFPYLEKQLKTSTSTDTVSKEEPKLLKKNKVTQTEARLNKIERISKSTEIQEDLVPPKKMTSAAVQADQPIGISKGTSTMEYGPSISQGPHHKGITSRNYRGEKKHRVAPLPPEVAAKSYVIKELPRSCQTHIVLNSLLEKKLAVEHCSKLISHRSGKPLKHLLIILAGKSDDILKIKNLCDCEVHVEAFKPHVRNSNSSTACRRLPKPCANERKVNFKLEKLPKYNNEDSEWNPERTLLRKILFALIER